MTLLSLLLQFPDSIRYLAAMDALKRVVVELARPRYSALQPVFRMFYGYELILHVRANLVYRILTIPVPNQLKEPLCCIFFFCYLSHSLTKSTNIEPRKALLCYYTLEEGTIILS